MIYRDYGTTGKKVSLLGFGGMRFGNIDNRDECVQMMVSAAEGGVTYFDTAPGYFDGKSEAVFGEGFAELKRRKLPYYTSTKTFKTTEAAIRVEIEAQLKRMNVPSIDFYHIWCITGLDNWQERKNDGVLLALQKLKSEGLIKHICVSSHLIQDQIRELLMEGVFDGVLFGYSAYNFKTREKAFDAIRARQLGAVVMNPLGGGVIPQHPELFNFLKRDSNEDTIHAALHFLWDHADLTTTLVGFGTDAEVKNALAAVDNYKPRTASELSDVKKRASLSMEGICTGCAYCDDCPEGIPIPKYMDAYNQKMLSASKADKEISDRLKWHWHIPAKDAAKCVACGHCEAACTQHIDIIGRLKHIAENGD
jgi:predicted aldo/keto reductase-like oxidoreductase